MNDSLSDCRFYGEGELPPHELRMMSAFNTKIANFNRKTIKGRQLGCFAYSPEEGTPAEKFEDQVPLKDRERRAEIIMEEQMIISDSLNEAALDSEVEVVCEGFDRYAECYYGRSQADAPEIDGKIFFLSEDKVRVGEYVKVKIDDTMDYDLIGSKM